jgi:hypothetical protein
MLYMMCSTTDLPLCAITFTMLGVNHFMDSVISINTQDFLSKMEGFTVRNHNSVGMERAYLHELSIDHLHYGVIQHFPV